MSIRTLVGGILSRARLSEKLGLTYRGKRDLTKALGYKKELFVQDYRARFLRNEVANRIVKALPHACWRGGVELIEDEDPTTSTQFEEAFDELNSRLKVLSVLRRADILAGIGRYAVIVMGAPGRPEEPLERCAPEDLLYLMPYSEEDAQIFQFDLDPQSPRFGKPKLYTLSRAENQTPNALNSNVVGKQFHWTRIIHVTDTLLDDSIYSEPRLQCVWNRIDDLEKVTGGGSEAFWMRASGGMQFNIDPEIELSDDDETDETNVKATAKRIGLKQQLDEYEHGLRRILLTRGVDIKNLGAEVADFQNPVASLMSLISAGTGIPQRVLMGSEQAKLASQTDRSNWDDRVSDRRENLLGPELLRPFVDRLLTLGVLPTPKAGYSVRWSQLRVLDDMQRAQVALEWANVNQAAADTVVTVDEIRERVLGLPPMDESRSPAAAKGSRFARKWAVLSYDERRRFAAKGKERSQWQHVHRAADRFPSRAEANRQASVRFREVHDPSGTASHGAR